MHATLENLPLELILLILAYVPDIQSLVCAVLTGPRIYSVFKPAEKQITETVLMRQLHSDLLHDALAADVASRKKGPWTEDEAFHFIAQYTARDHQPFHSSFQWQLSQASRLARLCDEIDFFLADLTSRVLTSKQDLSYSERNRLSRNFYRFQIYCHLFGDKKSPPLSVGESECVEYFAHFAPWENEQLACIYDYLFEFVDLAFEEVGENVPEWVVFLATVRNAGDRGCQQYHMSFGLSHIRRFAEARTAEERRNLLAPLSAMHCNAFFLAQALEESMLWGWTPLENFEPDEEEEYIPKPWYADADNGPETVWRWAHASQPSSEFTFSPSQAPLREWAYVMWDRRRLDDWKVMEKCWEYVDRDTCDKLEQARMYEEEMMYETRAHVMRKQGRVHFAFL